MQILHQIQQFIASLNIQFNDHDLVIGLIGAMAGMYIGGHGARRTVKHAGGYVARKGLRALLPF